MQCSIQGDETGFFINFVFVFDPRGISIIACNTLLSPGSASCNKFMPRQYTINSKYASGYKYVENTGYFWVITILPNRY